MLSRQIVCQFHLLCNSQAVESASLSPNERNLAIMITVFEKAFVVEEEVASRGSMSKGSGVEVTDKTPSLVSLTDLSHLLVSTALSMKQFRDWKHKSVGVPICCFP